MAFSAAPVGATGTESVAEHVGRGIELRQARHDAQALTEFEAAYTMSRQPMIRAQIALAEQALGRWVEAEVDLSSALAGHDVWVESNRAALAQALIVIQSHLGWLEVTTNVAAAELWLDGQPLGRVAAPFPVPAGHHELTLKIPDGRSAQRSATFAAGERQIYHVEFQTQLLSVSESPTSAQIAPAASSTPVRRARDSAASRARTFGYGAAALATVALAEAVAASLVRLDYVHRYNGASCAPVRSRQCAPYRDIANTFGGVAVIGYIVAGAAGLTSVALFTSPGWSGARSQNASETTVVVSGHF